jgi:hypothetical protein
MGYRERKGNELIPEPIVLERVKQFNTVLRDITVEDEKPVTLTMQNVTIKTGAWTTTFLFLWVYFF